MKLCLIDVSTFIHRFFHACPQTFNRSGTCVNTVEPFKSLLDDIRAQFTHCVACVDDGSPIARQRMFPAYKANRSEKPPELTQQSPLIHQLLRAYGIPISSDPEWEADDCIATIATRAAARQVETVIFSSDKDLRQLISPTVRLWSSKGGYVDAPRLKELWGITPEQVVDFQALCGDATDNIPGVKSIGPKTATRLLQQFGSLDAIYEHVDTIPGAVGRSLKEHADDAFISMAVAKLRTDLELTVQAKDSRLPPLPDHSQLARLLAKCEMSPCPNDA